MTITLKETKLSDERKLTPKMAAKVMIKRWLILEKEPHKTLREEIKITEGDAESMEIWKEYEDLKERLFTNKLVQFTKHEERFTSR